MPDPQPTPTDPTPTPAPSPPVPTPPAPADPAPTDPPADPDAPEDGLTPEQVRNLRRSQQQAAQYRTQLRDAETQRDELQATMARLVAAINPEAPPADDPAQALTAATAEVDNLRTEVTGLRAELLVHTIAAENGANPNALLDSRGFLNALQALDASADDYREQVAEAIKTAVTSNATLSATGPAPRAGGAPGAGQGSANAGGVTQEQFDAMSLADRSELFQRDPDTYRRLAASIR